MIVYFADRQMQVLGLASTNLPEGFVIIEDLKTEEVETGVATFSCRIGFNNENRMKLESMTDAGNYLLRSHDGENEFYTIIDTEIDTKNQTINIYAEDAGLDLLNEVAGEFEATEKQTAEWYINKYIVDSGFEIGINEIPSTSKRKLKWEGEETVTARLASIATQFDGYEISYSFEIKGLTITNKYVNIHKERGKDVGITLRLNQDIDKIITTKSVANLATAFVCEGGVPDKAEEPITLSGYKYDDGDFFVDGDKLKSRKANEKWSRYVWNKEPNKLANGEGYIVRPYSYNTTDQQTLCSHAITELKKVCDMEVNYEIDIKKLPANVKIGDRINIVDDAGELYVSTRILMLETSVVDQKHDATLGEHLIKTSGISQKVMELAEQFAKTSVSAAKALSVANAANAVAEAAQTQAEAAVTEAENATAVADEAKTAAQNANTSANEANTKADAAQEAVAGVEATVSEMEQVVTEAEELAESAKSAADSANTLSEEAKNAASNAVTKANEANDLATDAKTLANSASSKADTASTTANEAKTQAQSASEIAAAAKTESEQAQKDVDEWAADLETYKKTVTENYAKKTDLTETSATLQAQITANANQLSITHSKVLTVDETANNAKELAEAAQSAADDAQATANQATADAEAAQSAADKAQAAANAAQTDADNAKAAADAAQGVADQANTDLATAKANLASVTSRVDATEQDIAEAQAAVTTAQQAADKANEDAAAAAKKADDAQSTADTAVTNAANAKTAADNAASKATIAQAAADEAKGDAATAQSTANEAKTNAANAQATANTAVTNAATAQAKADQAALDAAAAQDAADDADAKAAQAQTDLNAAKQNLADTISRVDATEEDIAAAEKAVEDAQKAADDAQDAADAAQSTANTAKANAATAQDAADKAKTAADNAKKAADEAKEAADKAQDDVDSLAVRVTKTETEIVKSNEQIALRATKAEVDAIVIGGRNLLLNSGVEVNHTATTQNVASYSLATSLSDGETYTVSMCITPGATVRFYEMYATLGNKYCCGLTPTSTEKHIIKQTFTATGLEACTGAYIYRYPADSTGTDTTTIHWIKLEKGNKATDWAPAPEDVDSKFLNYYTKTETQSELSVMAGNITSVVSANYTTKGEFNNLEVGGRNLLLNSSFSANFDKWVKNGNPIITTEDGYNCGKITGVLNSTHAVYQSIIEKLEPNQKYTFSFWVKTKDIVKGTTNPECSIYCDGYYDNSANNDPKAWYSYGSHRFWDINNDEWAHRCYTFTTDEKIKSAFSYTLYVYVRDCTGEIYFRNLKLEKGTKPTDWAPAPEDVDEKFKDYSTTAEVESKIEQTASSITSTVSSTYAKKTLPDTRNDNQTPAWYITNYPQQIITEFKETGVIGLSGEAYCTLTTTVPWANNSGGYPKQVANVGSKEYWRVGTSDTAWSAWKDALGTAENAQSRVGTCESNITQLDNKITSNVTEIGALKTRASNLEIRADGITTRVATIEDTEPSGRNLVPADKINKTNFPTANSTKEFMLKNCWATEFMSHDNLVSILEPATTYTISYELELSARTSAPTLHSDQAGFLIYGPTSGVYKPLFVNFQSTAEIGAIQNVAITFTTPSAWNGDEKIISYSRRWTTNGAEPVGFDGFIVRDFKIEKGSKATEWKPAFEDDLTLRTITAESQIQQLIDKISMLVVGSDGATLWEQTAEGWSFNFADAKNAMDATTTNTNDVADLKNDLGAANGIITDLQNALAKNAEYITFGTTDDGEGGKEPCIELGVKDGLNKVLITNTRIIFKEGSATPTYIKENTLVSEKVEVTQELQQTNPHVTGRFVWQMRKNGNYGLSWKGV